MVSQCKNCGVQIRWREDKLNGKWIPLNLDGTDHKHPFVGQGSTAPVVQQPQQGTDLKEMKDDVLLTRSTLQVMRTEIDKQISMLTLRCDQLLSSTNIISEQLERISAVVKELWKVQSGQTSEIMENRQIDNS